MCKQKNVGPLPDTFRLTIRQEVVRGEGGVGGEQVWREFMPRSAAEA